MILFIRAAHINIKSNSISAVCEEHVNLSYSINQYGPHNPTVVQYTKKKHANSLLTFIWILLHRIDSMFNFT